MISESESLSRQELRVSVIIRNRDEALHLRTVLLGLSAQNGPSSEVILVDNASKDDSVEVAQSYGATIVHVKEGEFTYGKALNLGLAAATGDICVILSAHSLPLGKGFISSCVAPFKDPKVAAVRCVYAGKRADMTRWTSPEILDASATLQDIIKKGPLASGCAIRRCVWERIPFDEQLTAAEDKLWAREALNAGYTIVSPCDAVYQYIKPVSARTHLLYDDRDSRAVFHATGERFGGARVARTTTILGALWTIATESPRAAFSVINRELTRIYLRLVFPRQPSIGIRRRGDVRSALRALSSIVGTRDGIPKTWGG